MGDIKDKFSSRSEIREFLLCRTPTASGLQARSSSLVEDHSEALWALTMTSVVLTSVVLTSVVMTSVVLTAAVVLFCSVFAVNVSLFPFGSLFSFAAHFCCFMCF